MKKYILFFALLASGVQSVQCKVPQQLMSIATDPSGNPRYLGLDSSLNLLLAGGGMGLIATTPQQLFACAFDPSGNPQYLKVDSQGGLIVSSSGLPSGTVTSLTQGANIILTPSPITTTGSIALNPILASITSLNGNTITTGTGTLTLGSVTLNAGAGGTLGSNAFNSTAFAPLANPTFTGTVTTPALSVGSGTGLAYLTSGALSSLSITGSGNALTALNSITSVAGQDLVLAVGTGGTALTLKSSTLLGTFGGNLTINSTLNGLSFLAMQGNGNTGITINSDGSTTFAHAVNFSGGNSITAAASANLTLNAGGGANNNVNVATVGTGSLQVNTTNATFRPTLTGDIYLFNSTSGSKGGIEFQYAISGLGYGSRLVSDAGTDSLLFQTRFNSASWTSQAAIEGNPQAFIVNNLLLVGKTTDSGTGIFQVAGNGTIVSVSGNALTLNSSTGNNWLNFTRSGTQKWMMDVSGADAFGFFNFTTSAYGLQFAAATSNATFAGSVLIGTAGATYSVKSGANAASGTVTLTAGSGTITSTAITTNMAIFFSDKTVSGTPSVYQPVATVSAGSASVTGLATDNSTYNWVGILVN